MTIRIGSQNPATMRALRNSSTQRDEQTKSFEKLSSGKRINRAGDDAAGLAIANRMGEVLKGLEQGMANVYDGVSLLDTADGGLANTAEQLGRMKELAVHAANDTLSPDQREAIQAEFDSLYSEVDRVAESVEFNGKKLLDGSAGEVSINVGQGDGASNVGLDLSAAFDATALGLGSLDLTGGDGSNARASLGAIDDALAQVSAQRSELGASSNRLLSAGRELAVAAENTYASRSRIMDSDYAVQTSELARQQVLARASDAVLVQGRLMPSSVMDLLK